MWMSEIFNLKALVPDQFMFSWEATGDLALRGIRSAIGKPDTKIELLRRTVTNYRSW